MRGFIKGAIYTVVALILIVVMLLLCTVTVDPGYAGVIYNRNGGVENTTLSQGWHVIAPWKKAIEYPVSTETIFLSASSKEGSNSDDSYMINSKDGKQVKVSASYAYHMDINKLPEIFVKFRGQSDNEIEDNFIRARLKEKSNEISSTYEVLEIYGDKRAEITGKVFQAFSKDLAPIGIVIENFSFTDIVPDAETQKAIQLRVNARQALETAKLEQDKATISAETARVEAKGVADARLIEAEGQAKANQALQQSLTRELVDYKTIEKWNGQLPTVSGSNSIIQLPLK